MQNSLLVRLDARDRELFAKCLDHARARRRTRAAWTALTHLGGTLCSISAALLPFVFLDGAIAAAAQHAFATLLISHLGVQMVKRSVSRPRPSRADGWAALVREPDRFSFPSGHSCAAMAVCFSYAMAFPALAVPLLALAVMVGASRVFLGVHYPGDVVAGQLIAIGTALLL
jgi:undecaprenyl-diphosphatase